MQSSESRATVQVERSSGEILLFNDVKNSLNYSLLNIAV